VSTVNTHTIGIQNAAKDDGLTVVFNDASYIHGDMAVEFQTIPEWSSSRRPAEPFRPGRARMSPSRSTPPDCSMIHGGDLFQQQRS